MKVKPVVIPILACVVAISALAQTPPKPPSASDIASHHVKTLTTLLSLTSAQQKQATTIYATSATQEQALRESEKEVRDNLRTAVKNNDSAGIDQIASSMAQTMAQMTSIHAKADAAFYQILTSDQQAKFTELQSQHIAPLDGPGGPGGPPAMGFR